MECAGGVDGATVVVGIGTEVVVLSGTLVDEPGSSDRGAVASGPVDGVESLRQAGFKN